MVIPSQRELRSNHMPLLRMTQRKMNNCNNYSKEVVNPLSGELFNSEAILSLDGENKIGFSDGYSKKRVFGNTKLKLYSKRIIR